MGYIAVVLLVPLLFLWILCGVFPSRLSSYPPSTPLMFSAATQSIVHHSIHCMPSSIPFLCRRVVTWTRAAFSSLLLLLYHPYHHPLGLPPSVINHRSVRDGRIALLSKRTTDRHRLRCHSSVAMKYSFIITEFISPALFGRYKSLIVTLKLIFCV